MSSTVTNLPNGMVVVTHVYNAGSEIGQAAAQSQIHSPGPVQSMTRQFLKGHPTALGTVQIMVGLFTIATIGFPFGMLRGIFFCGAICYIIAGSLTVAAAKKTSQCLVNGTLGMNIVASLSAFTGTTLFFLDASVGRGFWMFRSQGTPAVLIILSALEFIVSICVSSFACKATCDCTSKPQQVQIPGQYIPLVSTGNPQVLTCAFDPNQSVPGPTDPKGVVHQTAADQNEQPPPYNLTSL